VITMSEEEIWKRIERIAVILRNEGIISTEAASEIADIQLQYFIHKYGINAEEP